VQLPTDGASILRFGLHRSLGQQIEICVPGFVSLVMASQPIQALQAFQAGSHRGSQAPTVTS
jgi:hypothetical protein